MEAKRETPAVANKLKKLIGRLCRCAINDVGYATQRHLSATRWEKNREAGGTEFEVMTFLGHRSPQEARKYVRAANRKLMANNAMARLK